VQRLPRGDHRAAQVERLLLGLGQDVRLLGARAAQPVDVRRQRRVGEQLLGAAVVDRDPLELDEDEQVLDLRSAVARERDEVVRLRVGRVGVLARHAVEADDRVLLLEPVELVEQLAQRVGAEPGDVAAVPLRDAPGPLDQAAPAPARLVRVAAQLARVPADSLGVCDGLRHRARIDDRR
jgi:hypothetical protein